VKRVNRVLEILRQDIKDITYKEACLVLANFRVIGRKIRRYKMKVHLKTLRKPKAISINFNKANIYWYPIY